MTAVAQYASVPVGGNRTWGFRTAATRRIAMKLPAEWTANLRKVRSPGAAHPAPCVQPLPIAPPETRWTRPR